MRRRIAATICAAAFATAFQGALAAPQLELPALMRIASRLSGLPPKRAVKVEVLSGTAIERQATRLLDRDYPRDQQASDETLYRALGLLGAQQGLRGPLLARRVRGVRGLYDAHARRIYVRRGPYLRQSALRELVHALQDQAFDLRRLAGLRGSRDAGLAASAAVEGGAAFASIQGGRRLASHGGSRIDLFLQLEGAFSYTTGARFAETLHHLGGRPAFFGALRRFPETTEQIFHVDAFLTREQAVPIALPQAAAGFGLDRDDTFGELDVRALLAVFQVPRVDHVGEGWGGGRSALYRDGAGRSAVALVLEWDTAEDASEWAEAVETYVNEAFDADVPGAPLRAPCGVRACWSPGGRGIAFSAEGARTALVVGPAEQPAAELAATLSG